jgi:hypothetical protein
MEVQGNGSRHPGGRKRRRGFLELGVALASAGVLTGALLGSRPAGAEDVLQFFSSPFSSPPVPGLVTGGGQIRSGNTRATFAFTVQRLAAGGPITGNLRYANSETDRRVTSVEITSLTISGNTAEFSGSCLVNGTTPCTFSVTAVDKGEPGTQDSFVITVVPDGTTEGGVISNGNIQVH